MERDVILITVDCWRHDTLNEMPRLLESTTGYSEGEAICHAAATDGSFSAIFASEYYKEVYDENGDVRDSIESLPEVLGKNGYSTGAFIGANPFLGKWKEHFDEFWNGDFTEDHANSDTLRTVDFAKRLLSLRQKYPVDVVAGRAEKWYKSQPSPRFLWIHLMDCHEPFHPGFNRGRKIGLLNAYISLLEYKFTDQRDNGNLSARTWEAIPELYYECIRALDEKIDSVLGFLPDDATVLVTGDHGEEFDHGLYAHARLYDECIRVPFLSKWTLSDEQITKETVRQIDVAPSILQALDIAQPGGWRGTEFKSATDTAYLMNHVPQLNKVYTGIRTTEQKLIKTYEADTGRESKIEYFDLQTDPRENENRYTTSETAQLEKKLRAFERQTEFDVTDSRMSGLPEAIDKRLEELGYK